MSSQPNPSSVGEFFAREGEAQEPQQPIPEDGPIGWRPESPKFDILVPTTLAPKIRMVALNESSAQKLFDYVQECGGGEGDEWLWAFVNKLRTSFLEDTPRMLERKPGRQMRGSGQRLT